MQNILFFGDSLTAGYGLRNAATEAYPALIEQKIMAAGLNYRAINAGLSGDTTGGGLTRLDYWISQPISVLVLELGINDIIRSISPKTISKNLQTIIDKIKAKNPDVKIVLMGMQIPTFLHSADALEFNALYGKLAELNKTALVPFFLDGVAGKAAYNLSDRLHPSAEGYKVIADKVWPTIKNLL